MRLHAHSWICRSIAPVLAGLILFQSVPARAEKASPETTEECVQSFLAWSKLHKKWARNNLPSARERLDALELDEVLDGMKVASFFDKKPKDKAIQQELDNLMRLALSKPKAPTPDPRALDPDRVEMLSGAFSHYLSISCKSREGSCPPGFAEWWEKNGRWHLKKDYEIRNYIQEDRSFSDLQSLYINLYKKDKAQIDIANTTKLEQFFPDLKGQKNIPGAPMDGLSWAQVEQFKENFTRYIELSRDFDRSDFVEGFDIWWKEKESLDRDRFARNALLEEVNEGTTFEQFRDRLANEYYRWATTTKEGIAWAAAHESEDTDMMRQVAKRAQNFVWTQWVRPYVIPPIIVGTTGGTIAGLVALLTGGREKAWNWMTREYQVRVNGENLERAERDLDEFVKDNAELGQVNFQGMSQEQARKTAQRFNEKHIATLKKLADDFHYYLGTLDIDSNEKNRRFSTAASDVNTYLADVNDAAQQISDIEKRIRNRSTPPSAEENAVLKSQEARREESVKKLVDSLAAWSVLDLLYPDYGKKFKEDADNAEAREHAFNAIREWGKTKDYVVSYQKQLTEVAREFRRGIYQERQLLRTLSSALYRQATGKEPTAAPKPKPSPSASPSSLPVAP